MNIQIIIWILIGLFLVFGLFPTLIMSYIIYHILLTRKNKEKWDRSCSIPDDEEYRQMFDEGIQWDDTYKNFKKDVEITSEGYHLVGEYFDFGNNKSVIIIPGRMESLLYSYYFAEPYRKAGYNVLAIDNRAHGLSDGTYSSLGQKEYKDILNWGRFLHDELKNESVVLHGICIGGSAALYALTDDNCEDYMQAMVSEGMYTTFYESFKNHMIEDKHPVFPFSLEVMLWIRIFSKVNVLTDGPIKRIEKMKRPVLFLHSKEDTFSKPDSSIKIYEKCASKKEIVWYDKGAHSRIRPNNKEGYDNAIINFLLEL